jgi:hypothetical protein
VPIERVSTAAKTYLSAIGAVAIYISTDKGKPINVGVARDLDKALRHLRKIISPTASFGWIAWGMDYARLTDIAQMRDLFHDRPPLEEMAVRIEMMAVAHGAVLTPHARAIERAQVYADYLADALKAMQDTGTLSAFNHAYKLHRMALDRKGESAQPYWSVMQGLRAVIIRALISEPKNRLMPADVIREIRQAFPWFSRPVLLPKRGKRNPRH